MSRNEVDKNFADVWFALYFGDDAPPPSVARWYLERVTDYATQRREWDAWYEADVDGARWALVGNAAPRVWLARVPGGYHVVRDDVYVNAPAELIDEAVFVLCSDVLDMEGDE